MNILHAMIITWVITRAKVNSWLQGEYKTSHDYKCTLFDLNISSKMAVEYLSWIEDTISISRTSASLQNRIDTLSEIVRKCLSFPYQFSDYMESNICTRVAHERVIVVFISELRGS